MRIIKPPHVKVRVTDIAAFFRTDTKHVEQVLNGDMSVKRRQSHRHTRNKGWLCSENNYGGSLM